MAAWALILLLLFPSPPPQVPGIQTREQQRQAILKDDHKKSLKDIAEIRELARKLEEEMEKHEEHIVDLRTIQKAERIEALAKNIRNRMKRMF
ncbi:MAG: hypothetical protein O2968_14610 [Acidobacteria bacterium]|nr:hypothetical protein [Acidobacteriota bacterium]